LAQAQRIHTLSALVTLAITEVEQVQRTAALQASTAET
jgi:hypothetical protein